MYEHRLAVLAAAVSAGLSVFSSSAAAAPAAPERAYPAKPARVVLGPMDRTDAVAVKFLDGLMIRAEGGVLTDRQTGVLPAGARGGGGVLVLPGSRWEPMFPTPEAEIDRLVRTARAALRGRSVADLNTYVWLHLPTGPGAMSAAEAIDALNALPFVELAQPAPLPIAPPVPGNLTSRQGYLFSPPNGVGCVPVWGWPGGTGSRVRVVDLEYSWNLEHQDLPPTTVLGGPGVDPFGDTDHGTAVLGQLFARNNGWGVTGGVYDAQPFVAPTNFSSGWNVGGAILTSVAAFTPGDVIVIEQQMAGPRYNPQSGTQFGLIPIEWWRPWYDAVRVAVANGVHVVMAAGNGEQNLDDPIYSNGNGGHWPFRAENDSGAIIVGAGAPPGSSARTRLSFSNFGSTLDLQGWGISVTTTGYGDLYSAAGPNLWYTGFFSGTSSATPIVAAAVAAVSSIIETATGAPPSPAAVRSALRATGTPQPAGNAAVEPIGPLPIVMSAVFQILGPADCNANGIPDRVDIAAGLPDLNGNGVPDPCEVCRGDFNADGVRTPADIFAFLNGFFAGDARCDVDGDPGLQPSDIFVFLVNYFGPCL